MTTTRDIFQLLRPVCWDLFLQLERNKGPHLIQHVDPDPIAVTLAAKLYDHDKRITLHDARKQRSLCAEYCPVVAWVLELME